MRNPLKFIAALSVLMACRVSATPAGNESAFEESPRMAGINSLGLESIPGSMPTFYSPHTEARAKYLQALLGGEIAYYTKVFSVVFSPITMAVLDPQQWSTVAGREPYGMPSIDGTKPAVFVMPADWNDVRWMAVPKREAVPPAMLSRVLVDGKQWDAVKFEGCDGIGTHEIGHAIIRQLGIKPPTKWFSEFLASYAGYAYLKEKAPTVALSNEIFWTVGLDSPQRFTKLEDFESNYDELQQQYPANYGWYQLALDQRVIEIYARVGVEYLREMRQEFAARAGAMDSAQLLSKLDGISPGWKAWAAHVEAGNVRAVLLPQGTR